MSGTKGHSGRKPDPTRLKLLKGNPGKRPLNANEPNPTPRLPRVARAPLRRGQEGVAPRRPLPAQPGPGLRPRPGCFRCLLHRLRPLGRSRAGP